MEWIPRLNARNIIANVAKVFKKLKVQLWRYKGKKKRDNNRSSVRKKVKAAASKKFNKAGCKLLISLYIIKEINSRLYYKVEMEHRKAQKAVTLEEQKCLKPEGVKD
jgi:hypothetical protein